VKFSVVIPTHGRRLSFLEDAVATVRRQSDADWELVIFDNAAADDIGRFAAGLADPRVRYVRSDDFLPVTESWNRAIDLATGDYVTYLGDDDGLAPGYFCALREIVQEFVEPEVVYSAIVQFLHPGVAPWERRGYVADVRNGFFFGDRNRPFTLTREDALRAVRGSLQVRRNFTFNMQAFAFSRGFLTALRAGGPIFRSPFPDYYLANVAMARARSIVVVPRPLTLVGVCNASFGYTLFNGLEAQGAELLNAKLAADPLYEEVAPHLLPGPLYNTNYIVTMEHVARNVGADVATPVDYGRYRRLQIFLAMSASKGAFLWNAGETAKRIWEQLDLREKAWTVATSLLLRAADGIGRYRWAHSRLQRSTSPYGFQPAVQQLAPGRFSRLEEIFDALESGGTEGLAGQDSRARTA